MNIFWTIFLIILGIFILYVLGFVGYREFIIEKPSYEVLSKTSNYEIREYDSYITASYTREDGSINSGFIQVAGYIFGGNSGNQKVAMTSPVIDTPENNRESGQRIAMTSPVIDDQRTTSFVLPSEYSLEDLPVPNNDEVKITEVPATQWAVRKFTARDFRDQTMLLGQLATLREQLDNDQVSYTDEYQYAFYDAPGLWWPLRRNEVWVRIEE